MRGFRAKDADRDRFVELIEAAYVDGQLGAEDRELRVTRALSAETLDELQTLTRDLQLPPGHGVVPPTPTRPDARPPGLARTLVVLVAVVALLGVGVASLVLFASSDTDSATSTSTSTSTSGVDSPTLSPGGEERDGFEMTAGEVRRFLAAYERQFGTHDVYEVGFYPTRVGVQAPVRGSRPRFERWTWDGAWRQETEASAVLGPGGIIDLGSVDVRRMFENIARAKGTLDVPHGKLTHILVHDWGDGPSVNIYIGNTYNETGYLKTTPGGEIVRSYPYDA